MHAPEAISDRRNRLGYALAATLVVALGLLWRSRGLALPPFLAKYGGDALWGLCVFLGFGLILSRTSTWRVAIVTACFATFIECLQLYHAPWIDGLRATRIGRLVLGSTFNSPDLIAYGLGIALGALAERRRLKTSGRES